MNSLKNPLFLAKNYIKSMIGYSPSHSLTINGQHWQWIEAGDKNATETVILLHGLAMSKNHWRGIIPTLAKKYRVVAPDIPCFKIDTRLANPHDQGMNAIAKELTHFIDATVRRPVHLIGHSMAATLATGLALRVAIPVKSLTLVSLAEPVFTDALFQEFGFRKTSELMKEYTKERHIQYTSQMFMNNSWLTKLLILHSWHKIQPHTDQLVTHCAEMEKELTYLDDFSQTLNVPTLIMSSRHDLWRDMTRLSHCFNGNQVYRVDLEGCRHIPFLEKPIQFSDILTRFLEQNVSNPLLQAYR